MTSSPPEQLRDAFTSLPVLLDTGITSPQQPVRHALCTDSDVAVVVMAELLPQPLEPEPHAATTKAIASINDRLENRFI